MKKYVDVILPLPLPKYFTYSLPDECAEEVEIGCRVIVPFGRKKFYTAIVRNVHYCAPTEYEVKDISALLDASPILLSTQFKFWEWLADYYLCTQGDVYKAALPSGLKLESETIVEYNLDFEADAPLPEREQRILDLLAVDAQQSVTKLEKDSGIKNILTAIKSLLDKEAIFVKEELKRTYKPKTEARVRLAGTADEKHAAEVLLSEYGVRLAMITMGPRGAYLANRNAGAYAVCPAVTPVDTTGAGDIFGGSAVSRLLKIGKKPEELDENELFSIGRFACTAASLSTMRQGGIPSIPEEQEVLEQM